MSELTPMQAACWFGRSNEAILGGVSAHLYTEFDGQDIDLKKLNNALKRLYQQHPMLRLKLSSEGEASIVSEKLSDNIEVDDFSLLTKTQQKKSLEEKRQHWTHQQLDLENGQTVRFSLSLLSENAFRLHIDSDMIAVDPSSFRILIEDLALFYQDSNAELPIAPDFFQWKNQVQHDPILKKQRNQDRLWWKSRLSEIAPAPSLDLKTSSTSVQSKRLNTWLDAKQHQILQKLARQHHLTFSSLFLGLFAYSLGKMTHNQHFRLNVPVFWREPMMQGIERTIGDFANLVILDVDMSPTEHLAQFCQQISKQLNITLAHRAYSGVQVMRDLSRYHQSTQIAPIVFTAALDLDGQALFSKRVEDIFGSMTWAISQGPQVALDAQVAYVDAGILINWDIRLDALSEDWVDLFFDAFIALLQDLANQPDLFTSSSNPFDLYFPKSTQIEQPLNSLQQAYLLGRSNAFALGSVAMQEFREYHGSLDIELFKQRLFEMVKRHDSLRTYIDEQRLVQYIRENITLNLTEIDLRSYTQAEAQHQIASYRDDYAHDLFDLKQPPWNITLFYLSDQSFSIFVRFDALILDGRSIAALMLELFDGQIQDIQLGNPQNPVLNQQHQHDQDQIYWQEKLKNITSPPQFSWRQSLDSIKKSRYKRQSLVISPDDFRAFSKVGARQGLFKNSLIMATILELLAQSIHSQSSNSQDSNHLSMNDRKLFVAVPVLPLYEQSFSNRSTFIVAYWGASKPFIEQANALQKEILEALQHLTFSGVNLARLIFEKTKVAPALPIVMTNGLSWSTLPDSHPIQYVDGLTQTPQVAMDIRFTTRHNGSLVFDIDYAKQAIADEVIEHFLATLQDVIAKIIQSNAFDFEIAPYQLSAVNHSQKQDFSHTNKQQSLQNDQILEIYLDVLGLSKNDIDDDSIRFSELGLRPNHLKTISKRINATFDTTFTPIQLIQCRDIHDVAKLFVALDE